MVDSPDFFSTRSSLLQRLRDASDAVSWQHFADHYQRLIFQVCLRKGLTRQEAEEVAQETLTAVAQAMPGFVYDRSKGSFKGWLARVTRNHTADFLTRKMREASRRVDLGPEAAEACAMAASGDQAPAVLDEVWESEWREHLLGRALARLRETVSSRSLQIFQLSAVQHWSIAEIAAALCVSRAQIYLVRHRVGRMVRREIEALRKDLE